MVDANYPVAQGALSVESAIAFAIMLAVRSKRSLVITGDPSVWDASWGVLLEAKFAAPAGVEPTPMPPSILTPAERRAAHSLRAA